MSTRSFLRSLDRARRQHTQALTRWVFTQLGKSRYLQATPLPVKDVRRILIVRNNKRIGNMYFMLPFVREVQACYPHAQVDLMLISDGQASVFKNLGLHDILISRFAFVTAWPFLKSMFRARKTVYDVLFMPHSSSSDTLICAFLHARNKVAFWGEETVGVFPHAVRMAPKSYHAARSALTLLHKHHRDPDLVDHTLVFTEQEIEHGQTIARSLRGKARWCFAYFRGARGAKIVADSQWSEIRRKFEQAVGPSVHWVEILSPDVTAPLTPQTLTYQSADLRELGAVLRAMDLFICGDTGPLHLADAANARCIGLYNVTNPLHYGCLNAHSIDVTDIDNLDAESIVSRLLVQ